MSDFWNRVSEGQKKLNKEAAAARKAKLAADAKAGKMLPKSVPNKPKTSSRPDYSESWKRTKASMEDKKQKNNPTPPKTSKPRPDYKRAWERTKDKMNGKSTSIQGAAARRITSPSDPTNKKYKGKYAGPDEFKGNTKMIAAWKAAGSPGKGEVGAQAKKDFAKNFKG